MASGAGNSAITLPAAGVSVCPASRRRRKSAGAGHRVRATPEIDVYYLGGDLQMKVGGADPLRPARSRRAPYMVVIYDDEYPTPDFTLSGPGVSIETEMNSTQMGGLLTPTILGPYSFQTGASTESRTRTSARARARRSPPPPRRIGRGRIDLDHLEHGRLDRLGQHRRCDECLVHRAARHAPCVDQRHGQQTLKLAGKTATTLRAGRYRVVVDDRSTKAGLVVGQASKHPIALSGAPAVGKTTHTLTFASGRWFLQSSSGGAKTYFTVR